MLEALIVKKDKDGADEVKVNGVMAKNAGASGAALRDRIIQNLSEKVAKIIKDTAKDGLEAQLKRLREELETDQLQISKRYIDRVDITITGTIDGKLAIIPVSFVPQGQ